MRPSDIEVLRQIPTAVVSDALDRLGLPGSAHGLAPITSGQRMCGPAFTVRYVPTSKGSGTVGDYVDDVAAGSVVVLDNGGRTDCTVWGDILTSFAAHRKLEGTVIYGVCRDVGRAVSIGYPIFSVGRFMRTGKDRAAVVGVQEPIRVGDVQVRPGDLICGDDDGVVIVDQDRVSEVVDMALFIGKREEDLLKHAIAVDSLTEARSVFGYHTLQREGDSQ